MSIIIKSGSSGNLANVTASGAIQVDGSAVTQPVSISGPITVTGMFWQATQPISAASLPLPSGASTSALQTTGNTSLSSIDTKTPALSSGRVPVDGSGVTQPVSGTVSVNNFPASQAVTGTFFQATQPISATSLPLPSGASTSANQATEIASLSTIATNIPTPVAKGTQGTNAEPVQDLKDSGRVIKAYSATFTAATTEALVTLTPISDGTAGSTATTFAVTAGKRFRVQGLFVTTRNAGAAVQGVVVNLRMTSTGSVTATSPLVATTGCGTASATANISASGGEGSIPDGLELSGTMQFGISQVGTATANNSVTLIGYEY